MPPSGGAGTLTAADGETANVEMPDTMEVPHPEHGPDLQSPVTTAALQAHDAQHSPASLAEQGVHFLPQEIAAPERRTSVASSAPTVYRERHAHGRAAHTQHEEVAEQVGTPTGRETREAPLSSPSQPKPSSPKRQRQRKANGPPDGKSCS